MAKKAAKKTRARRSGGGRAGSLKVGEKTEIGTVEKLIRLMADNDLSEIDIIDGGVEVHLRRGAAAGIEVSAGGPKAKAPPPVQPADTTAQEDQTPDGEEELLEIRSPMVGTFYTAPSPDTEPFVAIGTQVAGDTVVCIVEAMKVMNEIKAECDGTIAEICVTNAQPVEYGQALYRVKPL